MSAFQYKIRALNKHKEYNYHESKKNLKNTKEKVFFEYITRLLKVEELGATRALMKCAINSLLAK